MVKKIKLSSLVAFSIFSAVILLAEVVHAVDGGFCPRLEGRRSGSCRSERAGSTCNPGDPCAPAPLLVCEQESSFDMPIRNGGTCVAMEDRCIVTPEGRKCEQVCTKYSPATCSVAKAACCSKFKQVGAVPHACCGGRCVPVGPGGQCGSPPSNPPGLKLPFCGSNGGC